MPGRLRLAVWTFVAALAATPAAAQLVETNQAGLRMGHVHLNVSDVEAHKRFWTAVMGGTIVMHGPLELIQFPGTYLILQEVEQSAPAPAGSIVNHFGFVVQDMPKMHAAWKAAELPIESTENPNEVYLQAPDGIRVEVYGEPALPTAVAMNHIHFAPPDVPAIKRWYVRMFGVNPTRRPCVACVSKPRMIETGDLPGGVNLSFSPPGNVLVKNPLPTRGRAIDHIGFDVQDLDATIRRLEAQGVKIEGPVRQLPGTRVRVALLTDPWGTSIELTESLTPP
jgi:catechol 2,3-dioxygenase-like lactoylglutathione lyase family enzyme